MRVHVEGGLPVPWTLAMALSPMSFAHSDQRDRGHVRALVYCTANDAQVLVDIWAPPAPPTCS
jgi:hypothetical protein